MKKFLAIGLSAILAACHGCPVYAETMSYTGMVKECADRGFKYSLLVKYKNANIQKQDVIEIIAPRLELPEGWEKTIESVVSEIYDEDLQAQEVFRRIYVRCTLKYAER